MEKTGIIIGGGDLTPAFAEKIIRESGSRGSLCIAAADAGLEILDRIGVAPDILLGDFDTVKQDVLGIYTDRKDVEIIRHNPVKDASDMELTADVLLERGIRRVLVLGALGGRADHTMANLLLIYRMRRKGAEFLILDPRNRTVGQICRSLCTGRDHPASYAGGLQISADGSYAERPGDPVPYHQQRDPCGDRSDPLRRRPGDRTSRHGDRGPGRTILRPRTGADNSETADRSRQSSDCGRRPGTAGGNN